MQVVDAQLCPCCSKLVCLPCIKVLRSWIHTLTFLDVQRVSKANLAPLDAEVAHGSEVGMSTLSVTSSCDTACELQVHIRAIYGMKLLASFLRCRCRRHLDTFKLIPVSYVQEVEKMQGKLGECAMEKVCACVGSCAVFSPWSVGREMATKG